MLVIKNFINFNNFSMKSVFSDLYFSLSIFFGVFFFVVLAMFIMKYCMYKVIKNKSFFFKKTYLYWFFLLLFFILIFWLTIYKNEGFEIANSKIILFLTGYLLEISLSIDNIFVWFLIFQAFKIPRIYQERVLLYGVWGSIVLRFIMLLFGKVLFFKWHWLLYLFGIFFLLTGFKIIFFKDQAKENKNNVSSLWLYNILRVTKNTNNENFFLKINNKLFVTPLFLSLIMIEISDVIFSIDSIPAIFSITDDFFIILTANIFSVLNLRIMYSLISKIIEKFSIIKYGLSIVLIFIGFKLLIEKFFIISASISFLTILIIFCITFIIHIIINNKKKI